MSLQRKLNLFDATLLVAGNVVGAGIFATAGFVAHELPSPLLFISVWVAGGILTVCGALTYAEMTAMFPRSGGDYLFLKAAYGPWAGFLLGWICFWIINPGSIAVLAVALAQYAKAILGVEPGVEKLIALSTVVCLSLLNYRGVRLGGSTHNVWTLGSFAIIGVLIVAGLASGKGNWAHFHETAGSAGIEPLKILGPAMIAVIFSYSGWFVTAYIGEEVKRPDRNLPLSLMLGTTVVMCLYMLLNVVYLYALPLSAMAGVINVGQTAAQRLLQPGVAGFITLAIVLAMGASMNATILSGARLSYAMARDGLLWSALSAVHHKYGVPHVALLCQALLAGIFVLVETFENLLGSVVLVMLLSCIGSGLAHIVLRYRMPAAARPYKTLGYPFVPLLFVGGYVWIAVQIVMSNPASSLVGLLVTLSGLPLYLWVFRRRKSLDPAL